MTFVNLEGVKNFQNVIFLKDLFKIRTILWRTAEWLPWFWTLFELMISNFLENFVRYFSRKIYSILIIGHYFLENSRNIHSNWIKAGPQAIIGKANQNLIQFWCKAEQTGPAKVSLKLWKKWVPERNWDSIMNIWPSWCVWIPKWNF